MKKNTLKGQLKIRWQNNMLQYGIFTGCEYIDLDEILFRNVGSKVGITINDRRGQNLFEGNGKLILDYKLGYERLMIKNAGELQDLDKCLFDNVEYKVEIIFDDFDMIIIDENDIESEDYLRCVIGS